MADEIWFTVDRQMSVVSRDGKSVIGVLKPGVRYKATDRDAHWLAISGPDGTRGFVPLRDATLAAPPQAVVPQSDEPPQPEPQSQPRATSPPTAGPVSQAGSLSPGRSGPPADGLPRPPSSGRSAPPSKMRDGVPPSGSPQPAPPATGSSASTPSSPPLRSPTPASPAAAGPPSSGPPHPSGQAVPPSTAPPQVRAPQAEAAARAAAPGGTSEARSRSWMIPTLIAIVVVGGVFGGLKLFGGDDDGDGPGTTQAANPSPSTAVPSSAISTTQPVPSTTQQVPSTSPPGSTTTATGSGNGEVDAVTLTGLTTADIATRFPAEAAARRLSESCADLVDFPLVAATADRLQAGESFAKGSFSTPGCAVELWGIVTPDGGLRELSLQVVNPTTGSVDEMIGAALALITTIAPDVDAASAAAYLEAFGWLSSPDITAHEGSTIVGEVQMGTFTGEGLLVFYIVPAG